MIPLLLACLLAPRVLLCGGDVELRGAVEVALAPWGVSVIASDGPPPASIGDAETLGAQAGVLAVVWTAERRLWIWDRAGEQLIVRPLRGAQPLNPVAAAAAALSIKTVLRGTLIAPEPERVVVPPSPALVAAQAPASRAVAWRLDAAAGPRIWPSVGWETRLGGTLSWRWLALGASAGSGVSVEKTGVFVGRLRDVQVSAQGRMRFGGERLQGELALGPSLHWTTVEGIAGMFAPSVDRADASIDLAAALDARVGHHTAVGLFGAGDVFLRRQRYLVGTESVAELPAVTIDLGLRVTLELD